MEEQFGREETETRGKSVGGKDRGEKLECGSAREPCIHHLYNCTLSPEVDHRRK